VETAPAAIAANAGKSGSVAWRRIPVSLPQDPAISVAGNLTAGHHGEQEDDLWGV